MRTVAILAAVSVFFADKTNWGTGSLVEFNYETGKNCFCAMGGILKEGGCLVKAEHSTPTRDFFRAPEGVHVGSTAGLAGISLQGEDVLVAGSSFIGSEGIPGLAKRIINKYEEKGVHLTATVNAMRYLQVAVDTLAAKRGLSNHKPIWKANDQLGYEFIMEALALATKNAKRRHITGDRKKASVQAVAA